MYSNKWVFLLSSIIYFVIFRKNQMIIQSLIYLGEMLPLTLPWAYLNDKTFGKILESITLEETDKVFHIVELLFDTQKVR